MNLTVFTDASMCPKTGAAGWGAWAKRNDWREGWLFGGPMREPFATSNDAELCAVANALSALRKEGCLADVTLAMVQSDSTAALAILARKGLARLAPHAHGATINVAAVRLHLASETQLAALDVIGRLLSETSLRLLVRHVRGHRRFTSRGWVNEQCDRIAKKHMRARREALDLGRAA